MASEIHHAGDIPLFHFPYRHKRDFPFMIRPLDHNEPWGMSSPDRHTFYALFWLIEGDGFHHIDYTGYPIRPQTLYLMRPGQMHFFEVEKLPSGYSIFFLEEFLYLNNQIQPAELFYLIDHCPALYVSPEQANILQQIIMELFFEYTNEPLGFVDALQHLTQLLLIYVRRFYDYSASVVPTSATHRVAQFQRLVDQHFLTKHHVNDYSGLLGITSGYLNEQVKDVIGTSASQVVRQRITIEAKRLLAYTKLTVSEIGIHLGFKDSSYFARFFRRETGHSPLGFRSTYREKYRNAPY